MGPMGSLGRPCRPSSRPFSGTGSLAPGGGGSTVADAERAGQTRDKRRGPGPPCQRGQHRVRWTGGQWSRRGTGQRVTQREPRLARRGQHAAGEAVQCLDADAASSWHKHAAQMFSRRRLASRTRAMHTYGYVWDQTGRSRTARTPTTMLTPRRAHANSSSQSTLLVATVGHWQLPMDGRRVSRGAVW